MLPPESYEYTRYLRSKTTVDDRALNRVVIEALREELQARGAEPLRVLELGAGVGTMVARLSEWRIVENAHFTLVDRDAKSLQAAKELLTGPDSATLPQRVSDGDESLALTFVESDIFSFLRGCRRKYDLVLANAVLDLLQVPALLEALKGVTAPSALLWFTINFDGETIFLPELPLDGAIMALYHRSMDLRVRDGVPCGDSKSGRHLLQHLSNAGARTLEAGSSDWVVFPINGAYRHDEAYFLHYIVQTIDAELDGHPELDRAEFREWIALRHRQISRGELSYIAHQLDVAARLHGAGPRSAHSRA